MVHHSRHMHAFISIAGIMFAALKMHRSLGLIICRVPKLGEDSKIQNVLKVGPVNK
jgi:hypothetical protein